MLFARNFFVSFLTFIFVGAVAALPTPMPLRRDMLERREPAPLDVIPAYVRREAEPLVAKRQDTNNVPAEIPTKSPAGTIEPYSKRDAEEFEKRQDTNNVPAEIPTKSPAGQIEPYKKRQDTNNVPAEIPTKSPAGQIEPYKKRQDTNNVPAEIPTKSPAGQIEPYRKRQDTNNVPAEIPTKSPAGQIEPYKRSFKRGDIIPAELPVRALDGVLELIE